MARLPHAAYAFLPVERHIVFRYIRGFCVARNEACHVADGDNNEQMIMKSLAIAELIL